MTTEGLPSLTEDSAADSDVRYVVNPLLRVVRCSDDEVVVKRGTRSLFSEVISDTSRQHRLGMLVDRLRQPASIADLAAEGLIEADAVDEVLQAVAYLASRSILVCQGQDDVSNYVDTFIGPHSRLATTTIGVVGSGQIAARVVRALLRLGLKRVIALDESGSQSWSRALTAKSTGDEDAGEVAELEIRTATWLDGNAYRELLEECGTIAVLLDQISSSCLHSVNEAAIKAGTPWMSAFLDGNEGVVGPTYRPGESACYFEFELQTESSLTLVHEALLHKEAISRGRTAESFTFNAHADILAGFTVDAVARFAAGQPTFTTERALRIDFDRQTIDYQDVLHLPRCPACESTRAPYRHPFL